MVAGLSPLHIPPNSLAAAAAALAFVSAWLLLRAARHSRQARSWRRQVRELHEFSHRTLEMNLQLEPGQRLVELVHQVFSLDGAVLFDADLHKSYQAGDWTHDAAELARNAYYFDSSGEDRKSGLSRRVIRLGSVPIGGMVVHGAISPATNDAIASLVAITFDRYRAFANENQLDSERRAEQLRSTVLDSLAHAYKTPLTAIRAASTGLAEMGRLSPAQSELVSLIDEQAGVLNELTTRLLTTARLDTGEVALKPAPVSVRTLIDDAVAGLRERIASMKISIELDDDRLQLSCDRELITALLTQYVDNACKYSTFGTAISIAVSQADDETIFSVHSLGPEIPPADRERIFDRYYRSSTASQQAPGTGIGLAVAKRAAQMHGGHVWVSSHESQGTTFFAAIPTDMLQRSTS